MVTNGHNELATFLAIREALTAKIARAMAEKLEDMGDAIRGITWFSSEAEVYAEQNVLAAA